MHAEPMTADLFAPPSRALPPEPGTQCAQVLARLRRGPITPAQALAELGVMRLAAVVHRLKNDHGYNITAETVTVPCRGGRTARVARYHLTT